MHLSLSCACIFRVNVKILTIVFIDFSQCEFIGCMSFGVHSIQTQQKVCGKNYSILFPSTTRLYLK